jgi:hypothetical protein
LDRDVTPSLGSDQKPIDPPQKSHVLIIVWLRAHQALQHPDYHSTT